MRKHFGFIFIISLWLFGCAATQKVQTNPQSQAEKPPEAALDHFLNGALYDFRDQYEKALLEYYQALLYDSTSAQILKAIGRDLLRLQNFQSAAQYLKKALRYDPRNKEILYYLAEAHFNMQDFENAIKYFEAFFNIDPYNISVQNNLLYLYTQLDQKEKLKAFRERLLDIRGYGDESAYQLVMLYLRDGEVEKAQNLINKILETSHNETLPWYLKGIVQEMQGDTLAALQSFHQALVLDPDYEKAFMEAYRILRAGQDWEAMAGFFQPLLEEYPENYRFRFALAESYLYGKKYEEARTVLEPLLNDPEHQPAALEMFGRIAAEQKNYAEAEGYFKQMIDANPQNKLGWLYLAILYNQQSKYEKAIQLLQEALAHLPEEPELLSLYGSTLAQMKRYQEALQPLEKAFAADSTDLNTIVTLGIVYEELKMYDRLDSLYIQALQQYPDNPLLLNNYSYSLCERNIQLDKALEMAQIAVEKEPENGAYLDTIGWIYFKLGDYEKALEYIQKAVQLREDSAVVLEHLGDVYQKLGDLEQARLYWQKALEKDPDNKNLLQKLGRQ